MQAQEHTQAPSNPFAALLGQQILPSEKCGSLVVRHFMFENPEDQDEDELDD